MSIKIKIPASEIIGLRNEPLILESTHCCSRCDQSPAQFYEIHRVLYRVGQKQYRVFGKKYDVSKEYQLKISVCESCFQFDFLSHPEVLDHEDSNLGQIARFHSIARTMGALLAGLGFLLLTPLIPEIGLLQPLKRMWRLPVLVGIIVLLLTWLSQKKYQTRIMRALEESKSGYKIVHRAEVYAPILADEKDLSVTALEITLENEPWAVEVASSRNWAFEKIENI